MDRADSLRSDRVRVESIDAESVTLDELYERHRLAVYRYLRAWGSSADEADGQVRIGSPWEISFSLP